jgi:integrase
VASGAVVRYKHKNKPGATWNLKYTDASGRQVWEKLGREAEGWDRKKAKAELRDRLNAVERERYVRPSKLTFGAFADDFLATYPAKSELKRSSEEGYRNIIENHLRPAFGSLPLTEITVARVDRYIASKKRQVQRRSPRVQGKAGYEARSINRHLNVLSLILGVAVKQGFLRENVVARVERPKERKPKWRILRRDEFKRVEVVFTELVSEAPDEAERVWREQARTVFLTVMGTGMRRGEVLGLRWKNVHLTDPELGPWLRVEETWVRGGKDTPKSEAGERTVTLGPMLAEELAGHLGRTLYAAAEDRVFPHPHKGSPLDPKRYGKTFNEALRRAGIEDRVRPFHDQRHSNITNAAAASGNPMALMRQAGHSDFTTTLGYVHLAGELFRSETELAEARLFGKEEA